MTQPKTPPISIRLPASLSAELEAWAGDLGMTRNASIVALLTIGLRAGAPSAEQEPVRKAPMKAAAAKQSAKPIGWERDGTAIFAKRQA